MDSSGEGLEFVKSLELSMNIFLDYIQSKYLGDPLPLVFFDPDCLSEYKHLIFNQFDLSKSYHVDLNEKELECLKPLRRFKGRVLTCRKLLKIFGIYNIFTDRWFLSYSNSRSEGKDPISMHHFINSAILVPSVDVRFMARYF